MVFVGAVVVIVGLIYILMNIKAVDGVAQAWLPFIIGGAVLMFLGVVVMRIKRHR